MVFMCVICMVKEPPLVPLSYEHRQLLEVIVSPVINTSDLKGYEWLYCVDCKMLMQSVHNFQQSARKGVKAFKYMLSKLNKQTATQNVAFELISEAKQDPIAIKTEPETDLPSVDQKPMVPEEDKTLHEEVDIKMENDMEPEVDYSSDSTITCYGDSHLDQALKESTDPLESNPSPSKNIKITSGPVSQKILKKIVVVPQSANSQVKVIKKPDPEEQISKFIIALKPQAPKNVQLTENVQFAEIVRPDENVQLVKNMQLIKKLQLAKNVQIVKNVQLAKTVQSVKNVQLVKRLQPARNVHLAKILQQAKKQLAENVQTARNVQLATTVQPVKNVQLANKIQPAKNVHLAKILQQAKKQLAENVQTAKNIQTAKNLRPAKNVHFAKILQQAKNQLPEKVQTAKQLQLAKNSQPANEQLVDNEQLAKNIFLESWSWVSPQTRKAITLNTPPP
ncbi:uncharacterized protein LOC125239481 [Leguminivora glycinivorella]|uniref:uncharacterized protein LOC125239481 n=1 Tax=Leguminivora glycinivorella TaxID=1035111 RepID=UPI00200DC3EC|nr:uncharacterized protein LOC125239481 [Leguminivora glycinivorella]